MMKTRLLFALGLLVLATGSKTHAASPTQFPTQFPSKLPTRKAFRKPVSHSRVSLPKPKSEISLQPRATEDHGNVSVIHDDGTLLFPENSFDLSGASLVFTPQGNGYTVQSVTPNFVAAGNNSQLLQLAGGSAQVKIGFTFKFYGTDYTNMFVNSSGNITFG